MKFGLSMFIANKYKSGARINLANGRDPIKVIKNISSN